MVTREIDRGSVLSDIIPPGENFDVFKSALNLILFPDLDKFNSLRSILNSLKDVPVPDQPVDEKVTNQPEDDPMAEHVLGLP